MLYEPGAYPQDWSRYVEAKLVNQPTLQFEFNQNNLNKIFFFAWQQTVLSEGHKILN